MYIDKCAYCGEIVTESDMIKCGEHSYHKKCLEESDRIYNRGIKKKVKNQSGDDKE